MHKLWEETLLSLGELYLSPLNISVLFMSLVLLLIDIFTPTFCLYLPHISLPTSSFLIFLCNFVLDEFHFLSYFFNMAVIKNLVRINILLFYPLCYMFSLYFVILLLFSLL